LFGRQQFWAQPIRHSEGRLIQRGVERWDANPRAPAVTLLLHLGGIIVEGIAQCSTRLPPLKPL
jgi:hypothetical protein